MAADLIYRRADWKQTTPAVTPIDLSPQPYLLGLRRARLSHRLDLHGVLDFHQHPRANEDCPGLASSHSREGTLDTVPIARSQPALEADCPERSEAVRNAEANLVAKAAPGLSRVVKFLSETLHD